MIEILAMHGLVEEFQSALFCHRNLLDTAQFRGLMASTAPSVTVVEALAGRGRALTIDDGTAAGARAARVAREYGHAVTLFVNPWHVDDGRAYPFSYLNALLDQTSEASVCWRGQDFSLGSVPEKERFRAVIKREARRDIAPEESYARVAALQAHLGVDRVEIPEYLRPLTVNDLRELQSDGVNVENHFWSHLDPAALDDPTLATQFDLAKRWLRERLGVSSMICACPFGEFQPSVEFVREHETVCLMLHNELASGPVAESVVNRIVLEF